RPGGGMTQAAPAFALFLAAPAPIRLNVDARDAARKILHAKLTIPVAPGALTLHFPKWIPGEHSPSGPIVNLAGLVITAGGRTIPWQRDPVELWSIHLTVPAGASAIEVTLDHLAGWGEMTPALVRVLWNELLLYPEGRPGAEWSSAA